MESEKELGVDLVCHPGNDVLSPLIDLNKCEGKAECVAVCPYNVFEMRELSLEEFGGLNFFGRIKSVFHGKMKAFAVNIDACEACGLCVTACPENAISLKKKQINRDQILEDRN